MSESKTNIRNFRLSKQLDERLRVVAELVGTNPSTLLRDFVKDGTAVISDNPRLQEVLRRRYE